MKVDERVTGFSLNVKKDKIKAMKLIAKERGTTVSDMLRGYMDRVIKTEATKKGA
jgi:hypothetical protein